MSGGLSLEEHGERQEHLVELASALPEVEVAESGWHHLAFKVRRKVFGYHCDCHGDDRVALWFRAVPAEREALLAEDPERFYRPLRPGSPEWIAVRLDLPGVDWEEIGELLAESYRLSAPKRLAARLGG